MIARWSSVASIAVGLSAKDIKRLRNRSYLPSLIIRFLKCVSSLDSRAASEVFLLENRVVRRSDWPISTYEY